MADAASPSTAEEPTATTQTDLPDNSAPQSNHSDPLKPQATVLPPPPPLPSSSSSSPAAGVASLASSGPVSVNPSSGTSILTPPPPSIHPYLMSGGVMVPPTAPSFRPASQPTLFSTPQFSVLPNPSLQNSNFQSPAVQPPGVSPSPVTHLGVGSSAGSVSVSGQPGMHYPVSSGQPQNPTMRPYAPVPNGYAAMIIPATQGNMPPHGIPRYPSPYAPVIRPVFPPRPVGMPPTLLRPPVPGISGPLISPAVRPAVVPVVAPAEKPQTTVYVGKIAPTVGNDFILSLFHVCGPVKSWKRAQDPSNGTPRGFGFCEFESAEGVLRALRLLSKFRVDGQELVLNVNQATREYLERYVQKKPENSIKVKETESKGDDEKEESAPASEKDEPVKASIESKNDADSNPGKKENNDIANFGIVTDEDREADQVALDKLNDMITERLKTRPLPPPPAQGDRDSFGNLNSEMRSKSRDGDADIDTLKNDDKNDDDIATEIKSTSDQDKPETSSPDRNRRHDRSSRDRDRERDKREKERELERYERERERERARRERERELKAREAEQLYRERLKDWEIREREREYQRLHDKEREKDRHHHRRKEIRDQERDMEEEEDDDSRKRRRRFEEKKKKRQREKEEDLLDRLREEEEIMEAGRRADEVQEEQKVEVKLSSSQITSGSGRAPPDDEMDVESKGKAAEHAYSESNSVQRDHQGDGFTLNGVGEESTAVSDSRQIGNAPARKLGFGLMGSGKRTAVPSVFYEEDDDDVNKDKKMRPLVPIDYSTEELQAVQNSTPAAEALMHNYKEDRFDGDKERSRRPHDRQGHRNDGDYRNDRGKSSENKKLLDAKQLIDMIPKTKEELFSYEINWSVYDKHKLHERMRPWISKKITEFLGEEEATLVEYIVGGTQNHVKASQMLELLQSILDDEAEMFVLKMWRMLIFEIKKVETGLSMRSKT